MKNEWAISINDCIKRFNDKIVKLIAEGYYEAAEQELIKADNEILRGCEGVCVNSLHADTVALKSLLELLCEHCGESKKNGDLTEILINEDLEAIKCIIIEIKKNLEPFLPKE